MKYYIDKTTDYNFDEAVLRVTEELKKEGFGVLTEINIDEKLKEKMGIDFPKYKILGACNPPFAYRAITAENKIGLMLPCNVLVQQMENGKVEIAIIDPVASMLAIENPELEPLAMEIKAKLERVLLAL